MGEASGNIGFAVIVVLYLTVGFLAAAGSICISQRLFTPKAEQIFYGVFLLAIAGFYLAFTAYTKSEAAWQVEWMAVAAFAALGLVGARVPMVLVAAYPLHGLWDLLHELAAHTDFSAFDAGQLTAIPLAYGFFCLAYDFTVAVYFYKRRGEWLAAWES